MFELTSVNGTCVNTKELHDLRSSQEETDTRVVLYAIYGASQGYESIKVRSPDSEFFLFFCTMHKRFWKFKEVDQCLRVSKKFRRAAE